MKSLNTFMWLIIYVAQVSAYAECTPKDLTDPNYLRSIGKENLIDHFAKPRDQDSVGWCGAYATSDSLSYAVGEPVSSLDISINQYANEDKKGRLQDMSGQSVLSSTDVAKTNGYCPESVIPSDQTSSSNLGHWALENLMTSFQAIADDFKSKGMPSDYCVECSTDQFEKTLKLALPNATSEMVRDTLIKNKGDSLRSLRDLMNKLCEGNRKKATPKTELIDTHGKNVSKILDNALDNDSVPSVGMSTSNFAKDEVVPGGHGPHELTIIGRRPAANGKCEYLVRNSWGKSCSYYKPDIAANCDASKGSFWMSDDQLQSAITDVVVVSPVNKNEVRPAEKEKVDTTSSRDYFQPPVIRSTSNGIDFGGIIKNIFDGISNAILGIWQALSHMFNY